MHNDKNDSYCLTACVRLDAYCPETYTPEGVAHLQARNIHVPKNMRSQMPSMGSTRHDPNQGCGYGGRSCFAGRGRGDNGRGQFGAGRGRDVPPVHKQVRFDRDRTIIPDTGMDVA
jgi:hypothetical protein